MQIVEIRNGGPAQATGDARLLPLVMSLFFAFGFCTVLVDTLTPKLKAMFSLNHAEANLTQFCFFIAYFIVSIPAGWLLTRIGYLKGVVLGLVVMAAGCLMFTPAARIGVYSGFLVALFVLASGITIVQVAANPLAAGVGDPRQSHSRLTLAQAFNSLATMIGPLFGAYFILSHGLASPDPHAGAAALTAYRVVEAKVVQGPFIGIALALIALKVVCWLLRKGSPATAPQRLGSFSDVMTHKRLALGAVSIFAYVGAEVTIGNNMVNYLMLGQTLGAQAQTAGFLVSLYWGGAMVGRFIGAAVLRKVSPALVLAVCALCAGLLVAVSGLSVGMVAAVSILAIGLFNSIMFPTIFTLAIEELGEETPQGSGLLCLAIVGGAIIPLLTGVMADRFGLPHALFVPVICYIWILAYGVLVHLGKIEPARVAAAIGGVTT
jgi:FHS family L-fucose permease-like MFS transporter